MPSRLLTSEDLFSSRMMSMQSSTHSSQMNTVGPAISLRTSCWLLPQNEQYRVFLFSPPPDLLICAPEDTHRDYSFPRPTVAHLPGVPTARTAPAFPALYTVIGP